MLTECMSMSKKKERKKSRKIHVHTQIFESRRIIAKFSSQMSHFYVCFPLEHNEQGSQRSKRIGLALIHDSNDIVR